jgi:uncharacterized protein (TIGR02145 family)
MINFKSLAMKKGVIYIIGGLVILFLSSTTCKKEDLILPVVSTETVSNIAARTAIGGGNITEDGGGKIIARGIVWGTKNNPTIYLNEGFTNDGTGTGVYVSNLTNLLRNTRYFVRAYAENKDWTSYGDEVNFTTLAEQAVVITSNIGNITSNSASCGGNVTDDGGALIFERGVCWSISENPTLYNSHTLDGTRAGEFSSMITSLTPGKTYYLKAFARNFMGISFGNQISFLTPAGSGTGVIAFNPSLTYGSVTDVDGNRYKTIQIGTQTWMAENLKTTKYSNGDPIPEITDKIQWEQLTSGAYCNHNNEADLSTIYGRLYNWYAVNDNRNLAPEGWHVATDAEWTTLINYLGGNDIAGNSLKEAGITHWQVPNTGATNESGFSALPGGYLNAGESYLGINTYSCWWSATEVDVSYASYWPIVVNYSRIYREGYDKKDGHSVRCIKNK